MEYVLAYLLGGMTVAFVAAVTRRKPSARPPRKDGGVEETCWRETRNFLHYDGDEQKGE